MRSCCFLCQLLLALTLMTRTIPPTRNPSSNYPCRIRNVPSNKMSLLKFKSTKSKTRGFYGRDNQANKLAIQLSKHRLYISDNYIIAHTDYFAIVSYCKIDYTIPFDVHGTLSQYHVSLLSSSNLHACRISFYLYQVLLKVWHNHF